MAESHKKRTLSISKLSRLFGLSSNVLQLTEAKLKNNVTLDSLQANAYKSLDVVKSASKSTAAALSPQISPSVAQNGTYDADKDDDVLFPLPNDLSRTASPVGGNTAGTSLSPMVSALLMDLQHPQPLSIFGSGTGSQGSGSKTPASPGENGNLVAPVRSPSVSRLLSVTSHTTKRKNTVSASGSAPAVTLKQSSKLTPVSRASSVKKATSPVGGTLYPSASSTHLPTIAQKPRFKMFEDGSHEHNLRAAKRQEKLTNMLKDLLGAKKLRSEAKSAVPNILLPGGADKSQPEKPPTLFAGLVSQVKNNTSPYHGEELLDPMSKQDSRSFVEKYGRCQEVIGRGSFGVVRISHKKDGNTHEEVLYAVKEFKRRPSESEKKYSRRLTSEFCISSSLKHMNIIDTLDLLRDAKGDYCEVMEFCSGGDLYTLIIAAGKLEYAEADCFFKQLIRGVNYMHDMGVAHRDLKPENLLLTQQGVLKITDFGNGECFKMAWEKDIQLSEGICGSSPYIAPEEFTQEAFDPRCVDIWSCGVIYMAMRTGRQLWQLADPKRDEFFEEYLVKRKDASGYEPIESLKRARCRNVIYSILDPIPDRRINGKQILNSEWGREIKVCTAGEGHRAEKEKLPQPE